MLSPDEESVLRTLRERLEAGLPKRGMRDFDRRIGRAGSGWTSRFLSGRESRVPTLGSLLRILRELGIHPADFFEEALPRTEALSAAEARAAYEGARGVVKRLEELDARLRRIEERASREKG